MLVTCVGSWAVLPVNTAQQVTVYYLARRMRRAVACVELAAVGVDERRDVGNGMHKVGQARGSKTGRLPTTELILYVSS